MNNWIFLVVTLLLPLMAFAELKEFTRDYTYVAGEADSKISARQMAMQEVKRDLLSEIGTHIYSRVDMTKDSEGKTNSKQEIRAMTAGLVKVDVLEERWNGYEFYIKAKMVADPEEILKRINDLASNDEEKIKLKQKLSHSNKELEQLSIEMLALKRALDSSKSKQETQRLAVEYANVSKNLSIVELFKKGENFYWGIGESTDYFEAKKWYQKAAEQGHAKAQYKLGFIYAAGSGAQQNDRLAVYWYQKAAEQGYASAQTHLGYMYSSGDGAQQDYNQAAYWYQKAADQNDATGQYRLGSMYEDGWGFQPDYKQAVYWYQKAADQGYAFSQNSLGHMYMNGMGVLQDYRQAVYWYRKAADQTDNATIGQNKYAQNSLAIMYENGWGVQQDYKQAIYWYQRAASHYHVDAELALKRLR